MPGEHAGGHVCTKSGAYAGTNGGISAVCLTVRRNIHFAQACQGAIDRGEVLIDHGLAFRP